MKSKQISIISIILVLLTGIWIICMILLMQEQGSVIATFEDAYDFVKDPGALYYITYLNVVLLTIFDVVLFGMLYLYFRSGWPVLSTIALLFVPVYAAYNLFVYISQVSVVQKIISVYEGEISEELMKVLLGQFIQLWEHSTIAFINHYGYAILGIPSVLFGLAIYRMKAGTSRTHRWKVPFLSRATGLLLILNAITCFIGIGGIIAGNQVFMYGSAVGGGLFFLSLVGMSVIFWRD